MKKLWMCRICLTDDRRLSLIVDMHLQQMYESLTSTPFITDDRRPKHVCDSCCARLKNCYELRRSCIQSEKRFAQLLGCDVQVNLPTVANSQQRIEYKVEVIPQALGGDVKQEASSSDTAAFRKDPLEENDNIQSTDSEDDLSLAVVKREQDDVAARDPVPEKPHLPSKDHNEDTASNQLLKPKTEILKQNIDTNKTFEDVPVKKIDIPETQNEIGIQLNNNLLHNVVPKISKSKIVADQLSHSSQRNYSCDTCNKCFTTETNLKLHIFKHTGDNANECKKCKKVFSSKYHLERHSAVHADTKSLQCNICKLRFRKITTLTKHKHIHTAGKTYKCNYCELAFHRKCHLESHIRRHTGEKRHQCNQCEKGFFRISDLKRHILVHTGEKPYQCKVCPQSFAQKSALMEHVRKHTGEKPYECNVCNKRFTWKQCLKYHSLIHTGEKPYSCSVCQKNFRGQGQLINHLCTVESNEQVLEIT